MNILLLEDSESNYDPLKQLVTKNNPLYHFHVTLTRESFLEELNVFRPDLILAGNPLTGFNAMEALKIINSRSLDIPFIIITGTVSADFVADVFRSGADDYIHTDQLYRLPDAIDEVLKRRRLQHEKSEALRLVQQSEQNLKAIFESASESFILVTSEGKIEDFNNNARNTIRRISGKTIHKSESIFDVVEEFRKEYFASVLQEVAQGKAVEYDRMYNGGAEESFWMNFSFSPVREADVISGICITGRDITYKKLDEQHQQFEKNNLDALINNTSDHMWSVDLERRLITSNHAFDAYMLARSGVSPARGNRIFHRNMSSKRINELTKLYDRAFAGESFSHIDHSLSPVECWAEVSFYPIFEGSKVIGTACFSRDITERKKAETTIKASSKRFSSILNTIPANIALLDEACTIIEVNASWKNFADSNGYFGPAYCLGENYLSACRNTTGEGKAGGEKVADGIEKVIQNKLKEFVIEYPCFSTDVKRWFRLIVTPLKEKDNTGAVVMHIDVSEIHRLQEQSLKQTADEQKKITRAVLRGEEKERARLGKELHDNISQLLAAIKMKLGFFLRQPEGSIAVIEECDQYVLEAMAEARNLSHKMVLPLFDENGFIHSLQLLLHKYQNPEKSILLEKSRFDENKISNEVKESLYRIFQEQLHNIEKYAKASEVFIQLLTYSRHLSILIKDNGVGFNPGTKTRGIGLTNIRHRAESFNGSAIIISSPGQGCSLLIDIPITVS